MFNLKSFTAKPSAIQKEMDRVLNVLANGDPTTPEYAAAVDQLSKLHKLTETDSRKRVSMDTVASVAGSLAGIVIIVGYEHAHALSSKALGFVTKSSR